MPKYNINKSILIQAPAEQVFEKLNDFHHWPAWSPWLICEPEAKVNTQADGKFYEWHGKRVGTGNMTVANEIPNKQIDYDLNFLKPWKSSSKVQFFCQPENGGTRVTWTMDGSLPWFMFWMKKAMMAFIGSDYTRGLKMLKEYVENGKVNSKLEFVGKGKFDGCKYVGISTNTQMSAIGPAMRNDFEKLMAYTKENPDNNVGQAFSIYHKVDIVKDIANYTAAVPVHKIPDNLPRGFVSGHLPAVNTYTLRHIGDYEHLGNAWSTLYMMVRNKEFRALKGFHPMEWYVSDPTEVAKEELITDISFGIR